MGLPRPQSPASRSRRQPRRPGKNPRPRQQRRKPPRRQQNPRRPRKQGRSPRKNRRRGRREKRLRNRQRRRPRRRPRQRRLRARAQRRKRGGEHAGNAAHGIMREEIDPPSRRTGDSQALSQDMLVVERIAAAMDVAGASIILGRQYRFSASGTSRPIAIISRSHSASTG